MRTSSWVKLIGILCIVFGLFNILNALSVLLSPEMMEISKRYVVAPPNIPNWHLIDAYTKLFVNIIYVFAGIFFLIKKSFALNFMYISLLINILYAIIPLFIVHSKHDLIFILVGPFIDLLFLFQVYRLHPHYYKPSDEIFNPYGKYILTSRSSNLLTFFGAFFFLIPISFQILWVYSFNSGSTHEESQAHFYHFFPQLFHDSIAYFGLTFCILSIIFCSICIGSSGRSNNRLNRIILTLSVTLLLLILFQLM